MASVKRRGWIGVELDDMTLDYDCHSWEMTKPERCDPMLLQAATSSRPNYARS